MTLADTISVHSVVCCWLLPAVLVALTTLFPLSNTGHPYRRSLQSGSALLLCHVFFASFASWPTALRHRLSRAFRRGFLSYFTIEHKTPSVVVSTQEWQRPQVILTGPHGVFNMCGIASILTEDQTDKQLVCAIAPVMVYTWFEPILHMAGSMGMIPLRHAAINKEMTAAARDLMVIPGGFVETNTGNEHFATMDESKWDYWLLQCLRYGYDASFQWIHGGTQVYHTGRSFMDTRLAAGRLGIPCVLPYGRWGTPLARNTVPFSVAGFRVPVDRVEGVTRDSKEFLALRGEFRVRVEDLLRTYPPDKVKGQCGLRRISRM